MIRSSFKKLNDSPVLVVFFASLLLSAIARSGSLINRDGMFYVQIARAFLEDGLSGAFSVWGWPFFPILFASISSVTGLDLESAGYFLNALFMAGACALLVDIGRKQYPDAVWFIVLTVLALPGLNDYRNELLREYGAWFFMMLALWLANRYSEKPSWWMGVLVFPSVALGVMFRHEVVVIFPAILVWLFFALPRTQYARCLLISCVPVFLALAVVLLSGIGLSILKQSRLVSDMGMLLFPGFESSLNGIRSALPHSTDDSAKIIMIFGSLAIPPVRFIDKLGLFMLPMLFVFYKYRTFPMWRSSGLLLWAAIVHMLVLSVFVLQLHFLAGRYVAPLYLLFAPLIAYSIHLSLPDLSRFRPWTYVLLTALALSNVVSSSPEKMYFVHAGKWLAENVPESSLLYNESGRAAYFAGWRQKYGQPAEPREALPAAMRDGRYEVAVLEVSRSEKDVDQWLAASGLSVVQSFVHQNGDRVLVVNFAAAR